MLVSASCRNELLNWFNARPQTHHLPHRRLQRRRQDNLRERISAEHGRHSIIERRRDRTGTISAETEAVAFKAGKLLLSELRELIDRQETFALESTLSGKTYLKIFEHAKQRGYKIELHFVWIPDMREAIRRATRKKRAELRQRGLPMIIWKDGRVREVPA